MSDGRLDGGGVQINDYGQRIGPAVAEWETPGWPAGAAAGGAEVMEGRYCRLERLGERHAGELHGAFVAGERGAGEEVAGDADWTYLPYGPFKKEEDFARWVRKNCRGRDPVFYAVLVREGAEVRVLGVASFLRIVPGAGVIEVGHIHFARALQKTPAATEAIYLMMRHAFELGYRRLEWKCDSLNGPSRAAAQRFGFSFEGVFRNATIYKGRSRDTAWYAMTDGDWAFLRGAFERWLAAGNFDQRGRQRERLSDLTRGGLKNL